MEKKKTLKEMTVGEVLQTEGFYRTAERYLSGLKRKRALAERAGVRLRRGPFVRIAEKGYADPGRFIQAYAEVLDRRPVPLSSTERALVRSIGDLCFREFYSQEMKKEAGHGDR